jgi:hypothetical protein
MLLCPGGDFLVLFGQAKRMNEKKISFLLEADVCRKDMIVSFFSMYFCPQKYQNSRPSPRQQTISLPIANPGAAELLLVGLKADPRSAAWQ